MTGKISPKVIPLRGVALNYAWGKLGKDSKVAELLSGSNPAFHVEASKPYAELWMGTHPKAPSILGNDTNKTLLDWIGCNPDSVGQNVKEKFPDAGKLPFLFKVLSINISLSIQAHPNKELAKKLHEESPEHYPDANHKPEMAIALSPFECLCGFRPHGQIIDFLKKIPELREVVGEAAYRQMLAADNSNNKQIALKSIFTALLNCDKNTACKQLASLTDRFTVAAKKGDHMASSMGELLLRLYGQFPGDIGCFCIYFLNRLVLQPGEALFMEANLPHAYLSGDCIECMACSDNVLRAGLTPKFIDVVNLCEMLDYRAREPEGYLFVGENLKSDPKVTVFNPPVPDFTVSRIQVPAGITEYKLRNLNSGSIVLCIEGEASLINTSLAESCIVIHSGSIIFVSANEEVTLKLAKSKGILMFRAYCEL